MIIILGFRAFSKGLLSAPPATTFLRHPKLSSYRGHKAFNRGTLGGSRFGGRPRVPLKRRVEVVDITGRFRSWYDHHLGISSLGKGAYPHQWGLLGPSTGLSRIILGPILVSEP